MYFIGDKVVNEVKDAVYEFATDIKNLANKAKNKVKNWFKGLFD